MTFVDLLRSAKLVFPLVLIGGFFTCLHFVFFLHSLVFFREGFCKLLNSLFGFLRKVISFFECSSRFGVSHGYR